MNRTRNFLTLSIAIACLMNVPHTAGAGDPDPRTQLEKRVFQSTDGLSLGYRLFVPEGYDKAKKYPLILFLHGMGERGSDNEAQLEHAEVLRFTGDEVQRRQPSILVAPQCPADDKWVPVFWGLKEFQDPGEGVDPKGPSRAMRAVDELLTALEKEFSVDATRRYVTGLSMGGYGTYDLCLRFPKRFAAAVPICGGADPSLAKRIAKIPFWIFHGADDPAVPAELSRSMVEALKAAGGDPKYTEYEGVKHNSWNPAYNEPGLVEWVFSQSRKKK